MRVVKRAFLNSSQAKRVSYCKQTRQVEYDTAQVVSYPETLSEEYVDENRIFKI